MNKSDRKALGIGQSVGIQVKVCRKKKQLYFHISQKISQIIEWLRTKETVCEVNIAWRQLKRGKTEGQK
jgi:hypothetical protein